jgi:hypothetical protein
MTIEVPQALKLNKINQKKLNDFLNKYPVKESAGFQMRVESDLRVGNRDPQGIKRPHEKNFVGGKGWGDMQKASTDRIIQLYGECDEMSSIRQSKDVFFTCAELHREVEKKWKEAGYNPFYFYDPSVGYDVNAAINLELSASTKAFSAQSRSTFVSWITLLRSFRGVGNSYIYNLGYDETHKKEDKLYKREDWGVYPDALLATQNKVSIVD